MLWLVHEERAAALRRIKMVDWHNRTSVYWTPRYLRHTMRKRKELVGASTTVLILGVLARQPSYGYEIVKSVNDQAKGLFTWLEGTIYPVLHKLEKDSLIRG